jgi:exodeoxyribonuclease VII large subunit
MRHARRLDALAPKLRSEWQKTLQEKSAALARLSASLTHLNPNAVLARGYSIVTDSQGRIVRNSNTLEPNSRIAVNLHRGSLDATVTSINKESGIG